MSIYLQVINMIYKS